MLKTVNARNSRDFWILGNICVGCFVATIQEGRHMLSTSKIFANEEEAQKYIDWAKLGNNNREYFIIFT